MFSEALTLGGLLAAGFAYGACPAWADGAGRWVRWPMLGLLGVPLVGLFLASALQSDTLGWIFGLWLMVALPAGMLLAIGAAIGRLVTRRKRAQHVPTPLPSRAQPQALSESASCQSAFIDRDSVHPGDDMEPHGRNLVLGPDATLKGLVERVQAISFLPSIAGAKATWLIEKIDGDAHLALGVMAQQWEAPAFMGDGGTPLHTLFAGRAPNLFFRYCRQEDPDTVFARYSAD